ncbi:MAG: nucleoside-diphosphate kinase [Cryomorphaceae bacterium]|nr:MAG: nucleoside-diphosphate kinase [Cryomorphaceae bacterium]
MMDDKTFMMIKPDAVERGLIGKILGDITDAGFQIIELKMVKLSLSDAKRFYKVHKDRPFFEDLTNYMSRSSIVAAVLLKENAVNDFRKLIGSTDPNDAEEGTIRKKYAISKGENSVHGSDSNENAEIESNFHFS